MKVLIVDTIHDSLRTMLTEAGFECMVMDPKQRSQTSVLDSMRRVEGIVLRSGISIDRGFIDQCEDLRFIGRVGAGLEHIDVEYAQSKGIEVLSSPEGNRQAVAEHALGALLSLMNHIHTADREVRSGMWIRKQNEGVELSGKTVAIIGYGNTGTAFAKVIHGFGVRCIAYDKYKTGFGGDMVEEVGMDEVFRSADVVSLHLPYNEVTHYLVDRGWLSSFQKPIYLINTSRGGILRTADLLESLDVGKVLGACLDVLEYETENLKMPALETLPEEATRLLAHNKVLLTPHIAGLTVESYEKLSRYLAEKIIERFPLA